MIEVQLAPLQIKTNTVRLNDYKPSKVYQQINLDKLSSAKWIKIKTTCFRST